MANSEPHKRPGREPGGEVQGWRGPGGGCRKNGSFLVTSELFTGYYFSVVTQILLKLSKKKPVLFRERKCFKF